MKKKTIGLCSVLALIGLCFFFLGGDVGTTRSKASQDTDYANVSGDTMAGRFQYAKGGDIASATEITLGTDGNYFDITGTTQIDNIDEAGWQAGSVVVLQFDASVTVKHNTSGTGAVILLSGAGDFSATVDDTLQLVYDGVTFREISRTVI